MEAAASVTMVDLALFGSATLSAMVALTTSCLMMPPAMLVDRAIGSTMALVSSDAEVIQADVNRTGTPAPEKRCVNDKGQAACHR